MSSRILFVSYTGAVTGPTNSLTQLLKHLRRRYEVAVAVPGVGGFSEQLARDGIQTLQFSSFGKWTIPTLSRALRSGGFDLLYANTAEGSARNAFLAAKLASVPFICHVRALGWAEPWRRLWYLRFAEAVVAVSTACASSVNRFVSSDRLHVVYNGVPALEPVDHRQVLALRRNLGIPESSFLLLSLAHISRRKGQSYLVQAMEEITRALPSAHLILAGAHREEEYESELRRRILATGLSDRIHLVGFRRDVRELLSAADVVVHTATADPHPRAVLEAMELGRPVVAFAVDGVAETIRDRETGFLVGPGDASGLASAVLRLVDDGALRERMGAQGRLRVETHFRDSRTAERVAEVIDGVLHQ